MAQIEAHSIESDRELADTRRVLDAVSRALSVYVRDRDPKELFDQLLGDLLDLTDSTYGYIAEVLFDDNGAPYLRTWAITDISWNEETAALYDTYAVKGGGLEFTNLNTLFGWGLLEGGRLAISNDTTDDPRCAGRPVGHPPLNSFLGYPLMRGDQLIGQFAVANRPDGYPPELVTRLEPYASAVANMIDAHRVDRDRREAEAAHAGVAERLSAIVNSISDIVTILGDDGAWLYSSPGGGRVLGYPQGFDPVGGAFSLLHPDDIELAWRAFEEVKAGTRGPDEPVMLRVKSTDGSYRSLETTGYDLRDNESIGGVVLVSRDVTDRQLVQRLLDETTTELGALVGALRDGVLYAGADGRVVFVNEPFLRVAGLTASSRELIGRPATMALRSLRSAVRDESAVEVLLTDPLSERPARLGDILELHDGRFVERDYLPVELAGEARLGHLWLFRDVTERVVTEQQRGRLLESERTVRRAIEEQNRSLRELDRLKTDFVASVSHELRTPLTAIVSFSELLSDTEPALEAEQAEFLEIIQRNAERLLRLVGDLLLIARLESGTLEIHQSDVDLGELITQIIDSMAPSAHEHDVTVVVALDDDPTSAFVDRGRFEQVVTNLVSNAIKFTPEGGTVTISSERTGRHWQVSVTDTGIGIPLEEQDRLFDRFFRASNAREGHIPGTGLGLAITKALVELHGGSLVVESEPGRGTEVTVVVPDDFGDPAAAI